MPQYLAIVDESLQVYFRYISGMAVEQ